MTVTYGYLGPRGTHCEEALYVYLGSVNTGAVPYPGIEQVLAGVKKGEVTHGIVPLENSIEGSVNLTLDLLASDRELKVTGEVVMPVRHHLMVKAGAELESIREVVSHPHALAQCRTYLNESLPGIPRRPVQSTAEAAGLAALSDGGIAAIANEQAAAHYGLDIVSRDIHDCKANRTRFVLISKEEAPEAKPAKTSIIISITDRPGGLYEILKEFALHNINLTKIESRPAKRNLGDYLFFIDFSGHRNDPVVSACLSAIENMSSSFRILGSYEEWREDKEEKQENIATLNVTLDNLRQDIDIIDYQIVDLLAKRTQLVALIGSMKNGGFASVRDPNREKEVLRRVRENAGNKGVDSLLMEKIYTLLFEHFVEMQRKQKAEGL